MVAFAPARSAGILLLLAASAAAAQQPTFVPDDTDGVYSRGDRIGCMGNSGGGTQTSYLLALDDRITAAAPSCYITSFKRLLETIGPQDAEQNIFGQLAFGMDHAEYLTLFAPRPIRVCATTRDFFPIAGAKQAYERARGVYERLGLGERISFFEDDESHTWSEPLRIASVQWMSRWLRGVDELYVPQQDDMGITPEQMRITEHGQVMRLPGARSIYDLMRDEAERLDRERPVLGGERFERLQPLHERLGGHVVSIGGERGYAPRGVGRVLGRRPAAAAQPRQVDVRDARLGERLAKRLRPEVRPPAGAGEAAHVGDLLDPRSCQQVEKVHPRPVGVADGPDAFGARGGHGVRN